MEYSGKQLSTMLIGCAIAVYGVASAINNFQPVPAALRIVEGPITYGGTGQRRGKFQGVYFNLPLSNLSYFLSAESGTAEQLRDMLSPGATARVLHGGRYGDNLWGLSVNGQTLLEPQGALSLRRRKGTRAVVVAALAAAMALWSALYPKLSRPNNSSKPKPLRGSA